MMSKSYLNIEEFDQNNAVSTGGVTGSKQVTSNITKRKYQLKGSILDAPFIRRKKVGGVEVENFGEVIAASVSKHIADEGPLELAPKVELVWDDENKRTLVASRYLNGVKGNNL